MAQYLDIKSNLNFYLTLGFIFFINFSIAGCYLFFSWLLLCFVVHISKADNRKSLRNSLPGFSKYALIYGASVITSSLFSLEPLYSLKDNRDLLLFLLVPIFILVINSKKRFNTALLTLLASSMASSVYGIATGLYSGITLTNRLKGFTSHWMTYSGLLMFPFIYFFILSFSNKEKHRKLHYAFLILSAVAIAFGLTRSVWVGIIAALGLFIIIYKTRLTLILLPVAIVGLLLAPPSVKSRFTSIFDPQNTTNKDRIYMMQTGINIFKDYPVTGVGSNIVKKVYNRYKPAGASQHNPHLHNNFFQVLAQGGLLNFIPFILLIVMVIRTLIIRCRTKGTGSLTARGSLFVVTGFLIAGLFEYNFGDSEIMFELLFFLSLPFLTFFNGDSSCEQNHSLQQS